MIRLSNYMLLYEKYKNRITIFLPQTNETIMDTITPFADRKTDLTEDEEIIILNMVKMVMES